MSRVWRWTAFSLLVCAAFALALPWLDRAGTAVLGVAFMALALSPASSRASESAATLSLDGLDGLVGEAETQTVDLLERIRAYETTTSARG